MTPRVSVIVPVYEGEAYLAEAIESILAQTLPPAEVVIVDNGCTDASARIASGFGPPVRIVPRPHGTAPEARNTGLEHATGDVLAFLDADDLWEPERLERQLAVLHGPGRPDLVFGHVLEFHSPELTERERNGLAPARGVVAGRVIITLLVERATFDRVGPFDANLPAADFLDWLSRARALGLTEAMLSDVVARRRIHLGNTQWTTRSADLTRALRETIRRRERASGAPDG